MDEEVWESVKGWMESQEEVNKALAEELAGLKKALWIIAMTTDPNPALEKAWDEELGWLNDFLKE